MIARRARSGFASAAKAVLHCAGFATRLEAAPFQSERHKAISHRPLLRCFASGLLSISLLSCEGPRTNRVVIGSKNFTESLVLGELIAQEIEAHTQMKVERRFYLAGTYICHQGMLAGRLDIYPEYTGTALTAILKENPERDRGKAYEQMKAEYEKRFRLSLGPSFGFNDTFAMEIRGDDARRLKLKTLSESAAYASQWRAGFGYEFMERPDGFHGLAAAYGLHFATPPRIMDLGLLARSLKDHQIDLAAGNTTDGLIPALDLFVLEDDKHYFPPYDAVAVVRDDALARHPEVGEALAAFAGKISDREMQQLNYAVDGEKRDVRDVAREFLQKKALIAPQ
ncbi:MAG TPA: glycine betaine ABC transporter substrate-binding protein [Candidatus Sulfotelmatobacter sp.]